MSWNICKDFSKLSGVCAISGLFTAGIGFKKWQESALEDYKLHRDRVKALKEFAQKYVEKTYDNYTYEKYLLDFPNSDAEGFQEFKDKEWEIFKEVLDNFWEAYGIATDYNIDNWIINRFTDQVREKLLLNLVKSDINQDIDFYINEVIQTILDKAANEINNIDIDDIK